MRTSKPAMRPDLPSHATPGTAKLMAPRHQLVSVLASTFLLYVAIGSGCGQGGVAAQGFFPDTLVNVTSVSSSTSTNKWSGGVLLNDGTTVVGITNSADNILIFDSKNQKVRSVEVKYDIRKESVGSWRTFLWVGGVLLKDKKTVICFPHNADNILKFDTATESVTAIPVPSSETVGKKWLDGVLLEDRTTAVGIPHNSENILVFDSTNNIVTLVPVPWPFNREGNLGEGWSGGVLLKCRGQLHVVGVPYRSLFFFVVQHRHATSNRRASTGPLQERWPHVVRWSPPAGQEDGCLHSFQCRAHSSF